MLKHLILATLIAFSLQVDNCISKQKYCTKCNTEFYTLVEYHDYRHKASKCLKNSEYERIENITDNCIEGVSTCSECKRGYITTNSGKQCLAFPHCQTEENNNNKCQTCDYPFTKNVTDGKCEKKPLCKEIKENKCDECLDYYYPNKDGECKSIPLEYCMEGNETVCTKCNIQVSYLDAGKCIKFPDHCTYFSSKCDTCENGFYPNADGTACEKITINNCLQAKDADTCTVCEKKYYVNTEHKCSSIPITNCIYSTDGKKCQKCVDWYEPSDNGEECIQYCTEWKEICTQCDSNYDSFDYGGSCEVLDPSKIPPAPKSDEFSSFINFNLAIAALILSLIL